MSNDNDLRPYVAQGNPVNTTRGEMIRRGLLAVIRACEAKGLPLPTQPRLGIALGIDDTQVARHLRRLRDDGAIEKRQVGRRLYVREVRA